jgi:hypothetical protein
MGWYEIAKLVHFMALIALFGFFVIHARAGGALRGAKTLSEARTWLGMLEGTRDMLPGGAVMFLLSGIAMVALRWRGPYPFITVGMVTLLAIWITWAVVGSRHLRAIRAAVGDGEGAVPATLARTILDPARWGTIGALNGAALGVLVVMTLKLDWLWSVVAVLLLAALVGSVFANSVRSQRGRIA